MAIQNLGHGNNPLSAKEASSYHRPPTNSTEEKIAMKNKTYTFGVKVTEYGLISLEAESLQVAKNIVEDAKEVGVDFTSHSRLWSYSYEGTVSEVDYTAQGAGAVQPCRDEQDHEEEVTINMPSRLEYWTADEVAECLPYRKYMSESERIALVNKLWQFVNEAEKPTPLGGDGTNGTVETPEERLDPSNDDKAPHWWDRLSKEEQIAITKAVEDEYPDEG